MADTGVVPAGLQSAAADLPPEPSTIVSDFVSEKLQLFPSEGLLKESVKLKDAAFRRLQSKGDQETLGKCGEERTGRVFGKTKKPMVVQVEWPPLRKTGTTDPPGSISEVHLDDVERPNVQTFLASVVWSTGVDIISLR